MSRIERKDFLATMAAAGAGLAAVAGCGGTRGTDPDAAGSEDAASAGLTRVIRCRRPDAITDSDVVNKRVVKRMVDRTVMKLVRAPSVLEGWKSLFGPSDVVILKVNILCGPGAVTHREVAYAVVDGLLSAGVAPDNITIYDRDIGNFHFRRSGYKLNAGPGVKVEASVWAPEVTVYDSFHGNLATLLTRSDVTAIVNVPCLKHHRGPGVTCAMKNHYGSFWKPKDMHPNRSDPGVVDLNLLPVLREKQRLIVVDALRPLADLGPFRNPAATWSYGAIMAGHDPVAVDAVGLQIIEEWRAANGLKSIAHHAHFLQTAQQKGLGVSDLAMVRLVNI